MGEFHLVKRDGRQFTVLVDDEDLERVLSAGPWRVREIKSSTQPVYVYRDTIRSRPERRASGKHSTQDLHRFIMNEPDGVVDHRNGNGLDCRKENLRVGSYGQNNCNVRRRRDNKSGFKGVYFHARSGRWRATIKANGKLHHVGVFDSAEAAHRARGERLPELHGEFANNGGDQ